MKLYYDKVTTEFLTYDDDGQPIIQGDDNSKEFQFHFGPGVVGEYACRAVIERPDGSFSNEIYATPMVGYYKIVVSNWISEFSGVLKITARLKKGDITSFWLHLYQKRVPEAKQ